MTLLAALLAVLGWITAVTLRLPGRDCVSFAIDCDVQNGTLGLTFLGLLFGASGNAIPRAMVPLGLYGFVIFLIVFPLACLARTHRHD